VLQDLEERERNLTAAQGRAEMAMQTIQRENHFQEGKVKELEKKVLGAIFVFAAYEIPLAHSQNIYI
jgi:alpha/beta superfamily hydrolase